MRIRRKRLRPESAEEQSGSWLGPIVLVVMILFAAAAIAGGCYREGIVWKSILSAASCFVAGIAFVFIGLFEVEWLERLVGFVDGIVSGMMYWLWTGWFGTLSDSEFVGRQRARVYWVVIGVITFLAGCVLALGIL
jgi:hypothetical protein